uniref:Uncharacterized protein n=1 Tax=Zea mays TaxID=4577 RepID=B6U5V9_MAIZE|nr:hypothetical protein [Zea mays]|eukprot:NP_001145063.1 uncharacterized protein LOC100278259 [Zea mays]
MPWSAIYFESGRTAIVEGWSSSPLARENWSRKISIECRTSSGAQPCEKSCGRLVIHCRIPTLAAKSPRDENKPPRDLITGEEHMVQVEPHIEDFDSI